MKDFQGIPIVISRGTPYEIGLNHGKSAADRVQKSYEFNLASCMENGGVSEKELKRLAMKFVPAVEKYNKDYIEEVQGIADGAGLKLEDLMLLNSRTELQKLRWNNKNAAGQVITNTESCTSFAVLGDRTADGATYTGQSWDNNPSCIPTLIMHIIEQKNGKPSIAYCGEAGIISRMGMNSCGIGGGVNSLSINAPVKFDGVPLQFVLRGVMDAKNIAEAIDAVNGTKNAAVNNIMIGYRENEAFDVEIDDANCGIVSPVDGILTHTNHYVAPGHPRYPYVNVFRGNSIHRKYRSDKLLRDVQGKITVEDIQRMYRDHADYPQSICWHADESKPILQQCRTIFVFIDNLSTLEMHFAIGYPCEAEFVTFKPFDLL